MKRFKYLVQPESTRQTQTSIGSYLPANILGPPLAGQLNAIQIAFHCRHTVATFICLLALNAPIATKIVCFSRLLKCLRSLYEKQCGPRSDCSYRSSLFWVHAVCFYTTKVVCFSCRLKCLRSLYGKQCGPRSDCHRGFLNISAVKKRRRLLLYRSKQRGPRSDCSYRSSLFWVPAVCFFT